MSSFIAMFLLILCANLLRQVENKSVFGIGTRIIGDQLLMKDHLQTPPISLTEEPVIKFNYAIIEPITYIEIISDNNVYAMVNFSYENDLVEGTITSVNNQLGVGLNLPESFEVRIQIYGLNETMLNVNPAYILNKDQQFNGVLKPNYQKDHEALSLMQEDINALENLDEYDDDLEVIDDDDDEDYNEEENEFDDDDDKIIEQGERQEGDFLVYETSQISSSTTPALTNHSVTFYYIDIYYITYVKFILFEHFLDNPLNDPNYKPAIVEYGYISPTTLKAIVTDYNTTSLFVQMELYGYHPTAVPVDYKPFLSNGQTAPISSLRQLKIFMNARHPSLQQQQQQQRTEDETTGIAATNEGKDITMELGQPISPSNNVNCWQQASVNGGSCGTYGYLTIFNLIITMVVTMIFIPNIIY